jgi:hypothetical protein
MTAPTEARSWRRAADTLTRRGPRALRVAGTRRDDAYRLEGVASAVWDALASTRSTADVVRAVALDLGVTTEAVNVEVLATLEVLTELGVLTEET